MNNTIKLDSHQGIVWVLLFQFGGLKWIKFKESTSQSVHTQWWYIKKIQFDPTLSYLDHLGRNFSNDRFSWHLNHKGEQL
jgi:hypothetical protein